MRCQGMLTGTWQVLGTVDYEVGFEVGADHMATLLILLAV